MGKVKSVELEELALRTWILFKFKNLSEQITLRKGFDHFRSTDYISFTYLDLGYLVIFYDITSFQRRGFLQIISIGSLVLGLPVQQLRDNSSYKGTNRNTETSYPD